MIGNTATDLQGLRQQVGQLNGRNGNLGNAIQNLNEAIQAANNVQNRFNGDPSQLEKLAQQILEPLREVELELSRTYQSLVEKDKIRAAIEDEIPAAFQNEVKAYLETVGKGK
jgi:chromosome segregation ATPase